MIEQEDRSRLVVQSYSKINWYLEVTGRRPDGYHNIETLFQEINLSDRMIIERLPGGSASDMPAVQFECSIPNLAPSGANLVERAANLFFTKTGVRAGLRIQLEKTVPAGAGLGGGSANATATFMALDRMFGTRLRTEEIETEVASLGSDCAFFVCGGAAVGTGRGDFLRPVWMPRRVVFLVVPPIQIPTAAVYSALATPHADGGSERTLQIELLSSLEHAVFENAMFNRLEAPAFSLHPGLETIKTAMERAGIAPVHMTGSGSGLFACMESMHDARQAESYFKQYVRGMSPRNPLLDGSRTFITITRETPDPPGI